MLANFDDIPRCGSLRTTRSAVNKRKASLRIMHGQRPYFDILRNIDFPLTWTCSYTRETHRPNAHPKRALLFSQLTRVTSTWVRLLSYFRSCGGPFLTTYYTKNPLTPRRRLQPRSGRHFMAGNRSFTAP